MSIVPSTRGAVELGTVAVRAAWSAGRPDLQQEALGRLLALDTDEDPDLSPVTPALRAWWTCYDETGEGAPTTPGVGAGAVGRLATVPWELLPPVPLAQAWGGEGQLHDVLRVQAAELRRRHELAALAMVLAQTGALDLAAGRWDAAQSAAAEGLRLAEEVGAHHVATQCRTSLGSLAAARGDVSTVDEHTTRALRVSVPRGVRALSAAAYWLRGRAALFGGRPQEALHHLLPLGEPGHEAAHRTFALHAATDTAEAAVQVGRADVVESRAAMLETWAQRTGATWARAAGHRLRALTENGSTAEAAYRAALDAEGAGDHPFEHARTQLLYGEWLRRARRRADAGRELAAAAATFGRLGAAPLRARALREQDLAEGSGARRDSSPLAPAGLTVQELRVARLAAGGLTNREIAAPPPFRFSPMNSSGDHQTDERNTREKREQTRPTRPSSWSTAPSRSRRAGVGSSPSCSSGASARSPPRTSSAA